MPQTAREIKIVADGAEVSRVAAQELARAARASIAASGRFTVALAGGSTPRGAYSLLAEQQLNHALELPWERIHIFFGDERHVPPDHPESNYRMANEALLAKVPIPPGNVHRMRGELDAHTAAQQYEQELHSFFRLGAGELPRFDLVLLGIGDDGHTASLFPGTKALSDTVRLVVANWVEKFKQFRLTLTFPVLNNTAEIIFLVAGEQKAEVVRDVLGENPPADRYPVQRIKPVAGHVLWLLDRGAAKLLRP